MGTTLPISTTFWTLSKPAFCANGHHGQCLDRQPWIHLAPLFLAPGLRCQQHRRTGQQQTDSQVDQDDQGSSATIWPGSNRSFLRNNPKLYVLVLCHAGDGNDLAVLRK